MSADSTTASQGLLDAVIIGGGVSGLAAAWRLRSRRIVLLESQDRLGGRLYSQRASDEDYWLNFGAHLFPAPGGVVDSMARDVGLETLPITGSMMGIAYKDRILTSGRVETYPLRLPLPLREKIAFARAGLRLQRAVARYHKVLAPRPGEAEAESRRRRLAYLDDKTFADFLGALPAGTASIFACAAHRATAEPTSLSAGSGIGLFALVWAGEGSLIARNLVGGPSVLPEALGTALGGRVRLGAKAQRIAPTSGGTQNVEYLVNGRVESVEARHVIVAVPAPIAAPLIAPISLRASESLAAITYGPFLSMAILTNEITAMPWDDVYALATPGRSFDMFTNHAQVLRNTSERAPGGSLMVYAGGDGAAQMMTRPDSEIRETFLADLHTLYPETRGIIAATKIHRWRLGNVYAQPGRHELQGALEGPHGEFRNVHLAGDYFAELGSMEAAAKAGDSAAQHVELSLAQRHGSAPRMGLEDVGADGVVD
ncbi:NAD(P)/FAD-dependent oxidoreductase [Sphaerisporangium sp. NPDC051011]|uniref:flavin monoamine oxidase family protein n=1 Tax=Sphaerisporangium sp. NPDC051011 TaxID=3155792 RepID=UPI0033F7B483